MPIGLRPNAGKHILGPPSGGGEVVDQQVEAERTAILSHWTAGLPGTPSTEQRGGFVLLGRRAPLEP
jgi:hypothetical protein